MTLIVIFNAILALAIVGVIVAMHSHAIVTEHRLHRRRRTLWAVAEDRSPASATPEYAPERRVA